jgi:HK97 family phage prohead protease
MSADNPVLKRGKGRALKRKVLENMSIPKRTFSFHMKLMNPTDISKADLSQLPADVRAALPKDGLMIEGWASTEGVDRANINMLADCLEKSLAVFMTNPLLLLMHDWNNPIGKIVEATVTDLGLFVRAFVSSSAKQVIQLITEGILQAFSVGYKVIEDIEAGGVQEVIEAELHEISIVTIPRNQKALFSAVAGAKAGSDIIFLDLATGEMREDVQLELTAAKDEVAALQKKLEEQTKKSPDPIVFGEAIAKAALASEEIRIMREGLEVIAAELGIEVPTE